MKTIENKVKMNKNKLFNVSGFLLIECAIAGLIIICIVASIHSVLVRAYVEKYMIHHTYAALADIVQKTNDPVQDSKNSTKQKCHIEVVQADGQRVYTQLPEGSWYKVIHTSNQKGDIYLYDYEP